MESETDEEDGPANTFVDETQTQTQERQSETPSRKLTAVATTSRLIEAGSPTHGSGHSLTMSAEVTENNSQSENCNSESHMPSKDGEVEQTYGEVSQRREDGSTSLLASNTHKPVAGNLEDQRRQSLSFCHYLIATVAANGQPLEGESRNRPSFKSSPLNPSPMAATGSASQAESADNREEVICLSESEESEESGEDDALQEIRESEDSVRSDENDVQVEEEEGVDVSLTSDGQHLLITL